MSIPLRAKPYMDPQSSTFLPTEAAVSEPLALHGGRPARKNLGLPMFPGANLLDFEEEQAVIQVIRSKRLFRYYGPLPGSSKVAEFEEAFARCVTNGGKAIAVSSGTAALMCGLASSGVGPGDEVIVPAYTWVASAFSVATMGAVPVFAEVDDTLTLDPQDVQGKITSRTRAILPVHMRGAPARMDQLCKLASDRNLRIIEDVAQAIGGSFMGKPLGSFGDLGCFSLQFHKIITSGEGGVVTTFDEELYKRALMFHDPIGGRSSDFPPDEVLLGANFRMPELSAAVALVQLGRLHRLLETMRRRKRAFINGIAASVSKVGGTFRRINDPAGDTAIAVIFFLPTAALTEYVVAALKAENVRAAQLYHKDQTDYHVYAHWAPLLEQRTWTAQGGPWRWSSCGTHTYDREMCPRTLDLLGRAVHLDVNPAFSDEDFEELIFAVNKVLRYL